jgi:hypothetical protein
MLSPCELYDAMLDRDLVIKERRFQAPYLKAKQDKQERKSKYFSLVKWDVIKNRKIEMLEQKRQ